MNSRNPAASLATSDRGLAVLDRASRPLYDAARDTRMRSGHEPLESVHPLGVPLDRHREWYHYHHLFRDLLGAELERRAPELIQRLQVGAAAWCEANGLPELAIDHAQAAGDADRVARLVESIDALDWYLAREEGLGDLYEGLLERNASEKKSGAGQYFTPRPLIECMVNCIQPQSGEIVQDPAAGTGGFLIMADRYIKQRTDDLFDLSIQAQEFQRKQAFIGVELVPDAHRLLLMNAMLHGIESDMLLGDTLSSMGARLPKADVILTNPPFGTKRGGGRPTRRASRPRGPTRRPG